MAKAASTSKINKVKIRMYRGGTGDFFLLQFKKGTQVTFNMMIDCGCIDPSKQYFIDRVTDLARITKKKIDLLVVTHEHQDHISGFKYGAEIFKGITFKKVWFAWTEDEEDDFANDLRKNHSELDKAIRLATGKLTELRKSNYFENHFAFESEGKAMAEGRVHFIKSLESLNSLNLPASAGKPKPSMVELLRESNVIKGDTEVEFLSPGQVRSRIANAPGIRFYVLGPPRDMDYLDRTHSDDGNYDQRENPSDRSMDMAFVHALCAANTTGAANQVPFDEKYEESGRLPEAESMREHYKKGEEYRKIDHDWLFTAGKLAMRYETSINNTSLALAIQFEDSQRVLLFPGDAELGNWESWHNGLSWTVKIDGKEVKRNAEYLLNNTVFYKIGHHVSQNGTAKKLGAEMITADDLTVMATLDFRKIKDNWLRTMPNDLLCEDLIKKSKGRFYFSGECAPILKQAKTDRVTIRKAHESNMLKLSKPFDDKFYIDCEVDG